MRQNHQYSRSMVFFLATVSMLAVPFYAEAGHHGGGGHFNHAAHRPIHGSNHRPIHDSNHRPIHGSNHRPIHDSNHRPGVSHGGHYYYNGRNYNYYHGGHYWMYFVGGAYFNYLINGRYYKTCETVPADSVTTSGTRVNATTVCY